MLETIEAQLREYNQEHLLKFYDELNEEQQTHLLDQIKSIDFDFVQSLFKKSGNKKDIGNVTALPSYDVKEEYYKIGLDVMKNGEYAVVIMAGGQGSRLGYDGPKGSYFLEHGVNKTIFEIHVDKLKHIYEMTGVYTPLYIMTSKSNNAETIEFFENNNYFNYPKEYINFFVQDELPMLSPEGKIIMDSKFNIKMGANGSGGVYSSLFRSGMLDKMKKDNIKWVLISGVDNILTPLDGAELVGFAETNNYPIAAYITKKAYPEEKVGVFCKIDNRPSIIEYIQMTPEMNNARDDRGELLYGSLHPVINLYNIESLEHIKGTNLDYVSAFKKTNYIDTDGNLIEPDGPNAYKFETFVFDVFPYFNDLGLLNGKREEMFAPIKNATGVDSPETASKLYIDYYKNKQ